MMIEFMEEVGIPRSTMAGALSYLGDPLLVALRGIISKSTCFVGISDYLKYRIAFKYVRHRHVIVVEHLCPGGRIKRALTQEVVNSFILHIAFGAGLCRDLVYFV